MKNCYHKRLTKKEWYFIKAAQHSESLADIAKQLRMPYATIYKIYKVLKSKASFNYVVNYKKMNLIHITLFFDGYQALETIHKLSISLRRIYGTKPYIMVSAFVPYIFKDDYIDSFERKPVKVIYGYEVHKWRPDSCFSLYWEESNTIIPIFNVFSENYNKFSKPVTINGYTHYAPDKIDTAIILRKQQYPFESLVKSIRYIRRYDPNFPILSKQVLSYHYKRHVRRFWRYNSVIPLYDSSLVPFRVFYFEGREAPVLARILINLPMFYLATIDVDKAVLIGQPPCHTFENIYRIISTFDVEMPLGDLVMSSQNMRRYIPPLWHFIEDKRWVWKDVKVKVMQST